MALARAQLSMLSMVRLWSKYTKDNKTQAPTLPNEILPEHVQWLTKRFYEKANGRRKPGLLYLKVTLLSPV